MSNFSFPPPPPPPPKAAPEYYPDYQQNFSLRGRGRSDRAGPRGRGRGDFRGGRGAYNSPHQQPHYPPSNGSFLNGNAGAHNYQHQNYQPGQSGYQHVNGSAPHVYQGHSAGIPPYLTHGQPNLAYPSYDPKNGTPPMAQHLTGMQYSQHSAHASFKQNSSSSDQTLEGYQSSSDGFPHQTHRGGYGQSKPQFERKPKVAVSPAVPSFGAALPFARSVSSPSNPIASTSHPEKQGQKRKRKTNQLGLTPKGDEYEASEQEEEIDEEAAFNTRGGPLQIEYKGQVSILGNTADIRSWLEERKKRYPTKARIEDRQREDAKRQAEQAEVRRKAWESRTQLNSERGQAMHVDRKAAMEDHTRPRRTKSPRSAEDKVKKSMERHLAKAEKLRMKLAKAEGKIARANAESIKGEDDGMAKPDAGNVQQQEVRVKVEETLAETARKPTATGAPPDRVTVKQEPQDSVQEEEPQPQAGQQEPYHIPGDATMNTAPPHPSSTIIKTEHTEDVDPMDPDLDELTSDATSSADLSSDLDSDSDSDTSSPDSDSASSSAPSETTSKPTISSAFPHTVPPLSTRPKSTRICKYFLRQGHCRHGENCTFRHEMPERGTASAALAASGVTGSGVAGLGVARTGETRNQARKGGIREKKEKKTERKTLFQRLVEQELEAEARRAVEAVKFLGRMGFFKDVEDVEGGNVEVKREV